MKLLKRLGILKIIFKAKFFRKRYPLAIRWQLTNRCPSQCKYCTLWKVPSRELSTKQILELLDEISACGTRKISFSGGEPLLRDDIGEIIRYCKNKGISPEMNSTGFLLPKKVNEIKDLDLLKLSLDGPEHINELTRRTKKSYQWALEAAASAKAYNIRFIFTTSLTKFNIGYVEYLLQLAKKFNTMVTFQPLRELPYFNIEEKDGIKTISPSPEEFKKSLDILVYYKKRKKNLMRNSLRGLKHITNWPHYHKLKCWAGKIFCMIASNGEVSPCDRLRYNTKLPNCAEIGFKAAFGRLPPLPYCEGCGFCGSLELNYLMSFKFDILSSIWKIMA